MSGTHVHILMGAYNGAPHLPDQLRSIAAQTHVDWSLTCSDDSSDNGSTRAVIEAFGASVPQAVTVVSGPEQGFSANFMQMIRDLPEVAETVALADQDDRWLPDKLSRAQAALAAAAAEVPTLYCAQVLYWWPDRDVTRQGPARPRPPGFENALIENIAQGNTIALNPAAAALARRASARTGAVFAHDWWLYLLVLGAGGRVIFDPEPALFYRQHGDNAIGAGQGIAAQIGRKRAVLKGAYAARIDSNIAALRAVDDLLTPQARATLERFARARKQSLIRRISAFWRLGLYRQGRLSSLTFWGGAILGRV